MPRRPPKAPACFNTSCPYRRTRAQVLVGLGLLLVLGATAIPLFFHASCPAPSTSAPR